ncbi:MAG: methenyltetrahydromethanopterin cyclohydrolase [Planctomycetota bacterium]
MSGSLRLNQRAAQVAEAYLVDEDALRVKLHDAGQGAVIVDAGVHVPGGLQAGIALAEIGMSGLASVQVQPRLDPEMPLAAVAVHTDAPVAACLASQYAGWQLTDAGYFAMASGPMRAAAGREELFETIGHRETSEVAVGVLESSALPPAEVCAAVAQKCDVPLRQLQLWVAPTSSLAGAMQIVARSVETAMHKLLELGFDVQRVISGAGIAPIPPTGGDDLVAMGRTNDAILYGGDVVLWVNGDDDTLNDLVDRIPSRASDDFGRPFAELFEAYDRDFFKVDKLLFSPARIKLINLETGRSFESGALAYDVLRRSFGN